jgi:uncharacterized protein YciI
MLYSIVGIDNENSLAARMSVRAAHVARLNELRDAGRLIIAGPNPAIDSDDPGRSSTRYKLQKNGPMPTLTSSPVLTRRSV